MADSSSVDDILEFFKRNKFTKAEFALRSELGNRHDLGGTLQKLKLDDKESCSRPSEEVIGAKLLDDDRKVKQFQNSAEGRKDSGSVEASKEIIVKEVECEIGRKGSESKWKSCGTIGEQSMVDASVGTSDRNFTFSKSSDDTVLDLYSLKYSTSNGPVASYQNDGGSVHQNNFSGFDVFSKATFNSAEAPNSGSVKRMSLPAGISKASTELKLERSEESEFKEVDVDLFDNPILRSDAFAQKPSELWKDCSLKTVFPFSGGDTSTSYSAPSNVDKKEGKRKTDFNDITTAIKYQVDEVGRALYMKTHGGEPKDFGALEYALALEHPKEELPTLPPVRLKSKEKSFNIHWEEKYERDGPGPKILDADNPYLIGAFLDVPIGREINNSGLCCKFNGLLILHR